MARARVDFLRYPSLFFLIGAFCLALTISAPGMAHAEDEEEGDPPIARDIEGGQEHFEAGEVLREELKWSEAANEYWKAVECDPEHYIAHVRYQECARKAGDDQDEIVDDYGSFIDDYPQHVGFKLHRLRLDKASDRLPKLEDIRKVHSKNFDVLLEIGRANLALGQARPAFDALEKAMALKVGTRPDVILLLAEAEYANGKPENAYKRLDAAVKSNPAFWQARLALARWDLLAGRHEMAIQQADVVLQQRPTYIAAFLVKSEGLVLGDKAEEGKKLLQTLYGRVTQDVPEVTVALADLTAKFESEKAFKEATALYNKVLEADEENWRALYGLAWVLERQGKFEEAEQKYRDVVTIKPDSVAAVNSVGYCLMKQGRVSEAQVQFKRARDMDTAFVTALLNLASTYDSQAKYKEAIEIYEQVLKMPREKENMRALINAAFDHESLGQFPKALEMLEKAHELQPKDANIIVWMADNYYFQKKYKEAERWYQEAIAIDKKLFFAWRGLGFTLGQRKRWADSANALEEAKKIKPDDLEMYSTLGDIYWDQLKDLEAALENYQEYMQRGGTDPGIQDAITAIKKELEKKK